MQTINLYKYTRADGGVTVTPVNPDGEYVPMYRLVADAGKELTQDGVNTTYCADVETTAGWYEVDAKDEEDDNDTDRQDQAEE